jgi:hypothetical protein
MRFLFSTSLDLAIDVSERLPVGVAERRSFRWLLRRSKAAGSGGAVGSDRAWRKHSIGISRTGPRWCVLSADRCLAAPKDGIASASTSPLAGPFIAKDGAFLPRRFPVPEFGKHRPS